MKVGDLITVQRVQAASPDFHFKQHRPNPVAALVIKKYDVGDYWMVKVVGEDGCLLVLPEDIEVINESRNTRKK